MSTEPSQNGHDAPVAVAPRQQGRIYTRVGDAGQTSLLGKIKVWKDDPRVSVYGTLDEATSAMGMARATTRYDDICRDIMDVQGELIGVMSELATPPGVTLVVAPLADSQVERLERRIDAYETERIPSHHFVRPGGSFASGALDLARTVVRRAERSLVALSREQDVSPVILRYLNRLSDFLYVMARIDEQREVKRMVEAALDGTRSGATTPSNDRASLVLETANRLIEAGMRRAKEIGVCMSLAVADAGGHLIELRRMDGALLVSVSLAPNKAYTAAVARMPTATLAQLAQPGASLYGIDANLPNVTLVGGGLPLVVDGTMIGAVGASGGSAEQDIDVARAMAAALQQS